VSWANRIQGKQAEDNRFCLIRVWHAFLGFCAVPLLLPHLLRTYAILWNLLSGRWERRTGQKLWVFGQWDHAVQAWYDKIAEDFRCRGRFGYAYDDGLGLDLGSRIYNNWATYSLLSALGRAGFAALIFLCFFVGHWYVLSHTVNIGIALFCTMFMMASPLMVAAVVNKPEIVWWPLAFPAMLLMFNGHYFESGLCWSLLVCLNFSVGILIAFFFGIISLVRSIDDGQVFLLILGVMPGVVKVFIRYVYMYGSGYAQLLIREQAKGKWPTLRLRVESLVVPSLCMLSIFISLYVMQEFSLLLLLIIAALLLWCNGRLLYFADPISMRLAIYVTSLASAAYAQSILAMLVACSAAYSRPDMHGDYLRLPLPPTDPKRWWYIEGYPYLRPASFPKPAPLMAFFEHVHNGARILLEADGFPSRTSPLRLFWCWTDGFLPSRNVDVVSEIYTRFSEAEFSEAVLERFSLEHMSPDEMDYYADRLGVEYLVAYTDEMRAAMESIGYAVVSRVSSEIDTDFRSLFQMGDSELILLKSPMERSVVSDPHGRPVEFVVIKSSVLFYASMEGDYLIRYRFAPEFSAFSNGSKLKVDSYRPFDKFPTSFMRISVSSVGPCELRFVSHILPRNEDWAKAWRAFVALLRPQAVSEKSV
jgi:hypothetical protein